MFSNAQQHVPDLFRAIIEADHEISSLACQPIVQVEDWLAIRAARRQLSKDAEVALRRSPDHRNQAR
jgi:hypothetical protein